MRFACWNMAGGHTFNQSLEDGISYEKENLSYFIGELKKVNADIIVLQESHTPIDGREKSQAELIATELGYNLAGNHIYQNPSHIKTGNGLSLAILSKYPTSGSVFHEVPNPHLTIVRPNGDTWKTYDVGFLTCTVDYQKTTINIVDGHMVPFHYFKRDFMEDDFSPIRKSITDLFLSLGEKSTIIGCDFNYNDVPKLLPQVFENALYREAFVGIETTPGRGQQDHVLFSHAWKLIKSEVRKASADHFICIADIELM